MSAALLSIAVPKIDVLFRHVTRCHRPRHMGLLIARYIRKDDIRAEVESEASAIEIEVFQGGPHLLNIVSVDEPILRLLKPGLHHFQAIGQKLPCLLVVMLQQISDLNLPKRTREEIGGHGSVVPVRASEIHVYEVSDGHKFP